MTCICGHEREDHEYGSGPCTAVDEDGEECLCVMYEPDDDEYGNEYGNEDD